MPNLVDGREAGFPPRDRIMYVCTGCQGEPRGAMARIAFNSHPHVVLSPGDTVAFSSKIIPGNARTLYALHNQLVRRGIEVLTEQAAEIGTETCRARACQDVSISVAAVSIKKKLARKT